MLVSFGYAWQQVPTIPAARRQILPQYNVGDTTILLDMSGKPNCDTMPYKCNLGKSEQALGGIVVINLVLQVRARSSRSA